MKRISLEELLKKKENEPYKVQYNFIMEQIRGDKIRPVKASPLNGKKPALHQSYWLVEEEKDYSRRLQELQFELPARIATDYYVKHMEIYEEECLWVLALGQYLQRQAAGDASAIQKISMNERSFQIWGREKFLQKEQGKRVLKHCGIDLEQLNIYETTEPLTYYSLNRQEPQNILVIENKDTFYSMRRFLMEHPRKPEILGVTVKTLVYGAGKGILRSMDDFAFCVEPYMRNPDNAYLYFGDLDYEGIGIYEKMAELFFSQYELVPFREAYLKMLKKAEQVVVLPDTKEGQNRNLSGKFLSYFDREEKRKIESLLQTGKYIPQEILNISDL